MLDEYDVFMDSVNRRVSTKMIVDAARIQPNRQFIMISPQDMACAFLFLVSFPFPFPFPFLSSSFLSRLSSSSSILSGILILARILPWFEWSHLSEASKEKIENKVEKKDLKNFANEHKKETQNTEQQQQQQHNEKERKTKIMGLN